MTSKIKKRIPPEQMEVSKKNTNAPKSRKRQFGVAFQQSSNSDRDGILQPKKKISFAESATEMSTPKIAISASTSKELNGRTVPSSVKWQKEEKSEGKSIVKSNLKGFKKTPGPSTKTSNTSEGKPNWKDIKEKYVTLKKQRKEKKMPNYNVIFEAKRIWELVRRIDCPVAEKAELTATLHNLVKDNIEKIVFAHDTSRIVQWLLKLTTPDIRSSICQSLYPVVMEMMQKRFSSHVVRCMLKYGDNNCSNQVVNIIRGNVLKLITNHVSAPLVERIYSEHASVEQKKLMEQELFGNSWKIVAGPEIKSLKEAILSSSEMKNGILLDTKENVLHMINKDLTSSGLLHAVILQFFEVCSPEDKGEILALLSPHVFDLVGTKAGTRIGMQCCWFSSKKTKKSIIKQLKGKVAEVCTMEEGYWIILAILDSVDDTVLLKKTVISEILDKVTAIIKNEHGRRVVLYMVSHRDRLYFHPNDIALLEKGDNSGTVLKSLETRRSEMLPTVIEALLQSISTEISVWMHDASLAMVTLAVLKAGSGEHLQTTLDVLAKFVCSDVQIEETALFEHAGIYMVLKKLLKHDKTRDKKEEMFAYHFACTLDENVIKRLIAFNRGCFLLVNLIETDKEEPKNILLGKIEGEINELLNEATFTGARVLQRIITSQSSTSS